MAEKPILFNNEMVLAILKNRKDTTRRVVKLEHLRGLENLSAEKIQRSCKAPYQAGDILYVRETWCKSAERYLYCANYSDNEKFYMNGQEVVVRWRPSIHMPREAARIWLRVTDVHVERLDQITETEAVREGLYKGWRYHGKGSAALSARQAFMWLWHILALAADGPAWKDWAANPWVWVIRFERCTKLEAA